jgi:hypothetical protein
MDVTVQYFDGCPHWRTMDERVRGLADELGLRIRYQVVTSPEDVAALSFHGSPIILVEGLDPFPAAGPPGLACRLYETPEGPAGSPTEGQLRAALSGS